MNISRTHIAVAAVLAWLFAAQPLCAQQLLVKRQGSVQVYPAGTRVIDVIDKGVVTTTTAADPVPSSYIVELASPAVSAAGHALSKLAQSSAAAMRSDVKLRLASLSSGIRMVREYSTVLNGLCIETSSNNIAAIRALPGVYRIYEDVELTTYPAADVQAASTAAANPLAGIATGKNVRIGVIDTGIDYMHEALGGGYGPGYKVRGGYDFVNNDGDPMDDFGHGTHVAGIIAGDSKTLCGMASGALLYSYKAMNQFGTGRASAVIAAIERAIQDSVQVINMSIGFANGDPDDIISTTVDRAARMGIVVVAAAGNAGAYGSIGSPGTAREALTVGCIDQNNELSSFSSKGPVQKNCGLKPDVVAPGVGILSAQNGGGYAGKTGTSMSAPYVTAIAAALRELHPSWSAAQIRNAIIESAGEMPGSYFAVGHGKADPGKAVRMQTVGTPGMLSLGFDPGTASAWSKKETVYVSNNAEIRKHYELSGSASDAGIRIRISPSSVDIDPHAQAVVIAEFTADNAILADNNTATEGYTGSIMASSPLDTVRVLYSFFKGTIVRMQFDETPVKLVVHNRKDRSFSFEPQKNSLSFVVPTGTYDLLAEFQGSAYVVHEGVAVAGITDVEMMKTEASYPVTLVPTDERGLPIAADIPHVVYGSIEGIVHRASGVCLLQMDGYPYTSARAARPIYFSAMSPAYVFGYTLNIMKENHTSYTYETAIDSGITDSVTIRFTPDEVKRLEVRYDIDSSKTQRAFPIIWSYFYHDNTVSGAAYYDGTSEPLRYPFTQTSFYYKRTSVTFPMFHYREAFRY